MKPTAPQWPHREALRSVSAMPRSDAQTLALADLGTMTATVAHEMRNLLGGVELHARLLAEQCAADADLAPLSGRLLGGIKRLHAVAGNLLAVARRPQAAPERAPLDLIQVLTEVVDGATLALPGTGIRIETAIELAKAPVLGEAERLRQAFLNLLLNAVQAMPQGGVLTVAARRLRGGVAVDVRDTGVGMDRATLRRAFEPFFTTRPHGTGLGLAMVRAVVESHDARVRVSSRPARGTTFRLIFPLQGEAS
jgi:two-component system sensor histidine kinase HydH